MPSNGLFWYAYAVIDVWSREIVGWTIHDSESEKYARELFLRIKTKRDLKGTWLHADNGNPMRGAAFAVTLANMGMFLSHSRPLVKNDNPFMSHSSGLSNTMLVIRGALPLLMRPGVGRQISSTGITLFIGIRESVMSHHYSGEQVYHPIYSPEGTGHFRRHGRSTLNVFRKGVLGCGGSVWLST